MATRFVLPHQAIYNINGAPFSGAKAYFYEAGTSTPKDTYSDSALSTANTNPVIADASGRFGDIFMSGTYKTVITDENGVQIYETDPVSSAPDSSDLPYTSSGGEETTVQSKLRETVSVSDHGAVGDGVTDDVLEFQAAIDSFTDGTIGVIVVPTGSYAGDFSTLTYGSRTIVFDEQGEVDYPGTAPTANRDHSAFGTDVTRPWFYGVNGFVNDQTDGGSTDRPTIYAVRSVNHDDGTVNQNKAAISAYTKVNFTSGDVDNHENAYVGQVDSYRDDMVSGTANISVFQGTCFKHNESVGGFFGCNFVARDQTTRQSSVSGGGLVGAEFGVVASGPDNSDSRIIVDVIGKEYDTSADGATSVNSGVRVRPSESGVLSSGGVNIENGVYVSEGSIGTVSNCFRADGGGNGVKLTGTYNNAAIDVDTDNASSVRIGCSLDSSTISNFVSFGHNSAAEDTIYTRIRSVINTNTDGAEDGRIDFMVMIAGTETVSFKLNGVEATDPIQIRVGGDLVQVTAGANDSATAGFRELRVPNS